MRTWLAATLFLLLAVPYHPDWQNYESARRGLLLILVPVFCLGPRMFPTSMPKLLAPFLLLVAWLVIRSIAVTNAGTGLERAMLWLALLGLMIVGGNLKPQDVCRAMLPAGLVVASVALLYRSESTLGNINVASEVLTMTGAAAALLPCVGEKNRGWLGVSLATLFLCGAAIVANTSLSGLIALPLATLPILFAGATKGRIRFAIVAVLAAGMLLGTGLRPDTGAAAPGRPAESAPTGQLRLELWAGAWQMVWDAPVFGHGTGQFPVEYPPFRSPEEIELTTVGRSFPITAESPHNDYLELAADTGIPGLALLIWALVLVLKNTPFYLWGPLIGFGFLAGVRSPLGNAPAVAFLFLFLGTTVRDVRPQVSLEFRHRKAMLVLLGIAVLWVGMSVFCGQWEFRGYMQQAKLRKVLSPEASAATDSALFWNCYSEKFLQARADRGLRLLKRGTGSIEDAERFLQEFLALWPYHDNGLLWLAELRHKQGQRIPAQAVLNRLLQIDPQNPRAILHKATILVDDKEAAAAIAVLYADPHPRLRQSLTSVVADLHARAQQSNYAAGAKILVREHAFLDAVDELLKEPGEKSQEVVKTFLEIEGQTPPDDRDIRGPMIAALQFLALDHRADAEKLAQRAHFRLSEVHRRLFGPLVDRLMTLPSWRQVLQSGAKG